MHVAPAHRFVVHAADESALLLGKVTNAHVKPNCIDPSFRHRNQKGGPAMRHNY
jgi:hypothetical protein